MDETEKNLPSWILSSRKKNQKALEHLELIRSTTQADIKRSLETDKLVRPVLEEAKYIQQILDQNLPD